MQRKKYNKQDIIYDIYNIKFYGNVKFKYINYINIGYINNCLFYL